MAVPGGPTDNVSAVGSDNGLMPNRPQAIFWVNQSHRNGNVVILTKFQSLEMTTSGTDSDEIQINDIIFLFQLSQVSWRRESTPGAPFF